MTLQPTEQSIHDSINLARLVRRLEKSVAEDDWNDGRYDTWIKAKITLQNIKYAKKLLKNTELYDSDGSAKSAKRIHDLQNSIDRVERFVLEAEKRTAPKLSRPERLLPHVPTPPPPPPTPPSDSPITTSPPPEGTLLPVAAEEHRPSPTDNLLLSPSDSSALSTPEPLRPSSNSFLPTSPSPRVPFQNTTALHEDLTSQLSLMATQLKRNAQHFSSSLSKDQALLEETKEKLEGNYDVMHKERVRLKDHRKESWWTTGLSIGSLVLVGVVFLIMFFVIKITR